MATNRECQVSPHSVRITDEVHGETTDQTVDIFEREQSFYKTVMPDIVARFPRLKIVSLTQRTLNVELQEAWSLLGPRILTTCGLGVWGVGW
eukprot:1968508-Amphidinium_carterae.1